MSKDKVVAYFKKVDPKLYALITDTPEEVFKLKKSKNYFQSLCREITSQQLSTKVAHVIFLRFLKLFKEENVNPNDLSNLSEQTLRDVGLSWSKVKYIRDLGLKVKSGEVNLKKFDRLSDQEIKEELVKVKGIGEWTAEMFLMFCLGREDVFSFGDLGIKKAIKQVYNLKELDREKAEEISLRWSPYRTYACRILWKSLDNKAIWL